MKLVLATNNNDKIREMKNLLDELDMVIVTTADPFYLVHTGESWKNEKACFNLVGKFIDSLPSE